MKFQDRYSRQVLFPGIGPDGQARLAQGWVAIVGCGATGTCVSGLLARAGVGHLLIIDRDYVEPSNLQRQSLFDEAEVADLTPENIETLLGDANLILDATDNFETRYLINDFAVKHGKPWIYAAAVAAYAVTMNIIPGETACLACVFPAPPEGTVETCDTAGILNSAVNLVGSIQATEAIKFLVGARDKLRRTLLSFDVWSNEQAEIAAVRPRPGCQTCEKREFPHLAGERRPQVTLCGRNSVQIHERNRPVDLPEMSARPGADGTVKHNAFVLKFWRDPYEMTLFPDGRAIIKGTDDTAVARSLYARFVGS